MLSNCNKNCTWCDYALLCLEKFDIVHNTKNDDNKKGKTTSLDSKSKDE